MQQETFEYAVRTQVNGVNYKVWWKHWPTVFGDVCWNVLNMDTGKGAGGFVADQIEARYAAIAYICEQEGVEEAVVPL